jgi:hypothetical protein
VAVGEGALVEGCTKKVCDLEWYFCNNSCWAFDSPARASLMWEEHIVESPGREAAACTGPEGVPLHYILPIVWLDSACPTHYSVVVFT